MRNFQALFRMMIKRLVSMRNIILLVLLLVLSISSVFFSNPILLSELTARINSIITLNIFSNCRGGLVLRGNSPFTPRFSNIVLVLEPLLVLFLGFIILLGMAAYFLFKRSLGHISTKEIKELAEVDLELDKGDLKVYLTIWEHFKKVLFNMFTGEELKNNLNKTIAELKSYNRIIKMDRKEERRI